MHYERGAKTTLEVAAHTLRTMGLPDSDAQADRLESIAASLDGVRVNAKVMEAYRVGCGMSRAEFNAWKPEIKAGLEAAIRTAIGEKP